MGSCMYPSVSGQNDQNLRSVGKPISDQNGQYLFLFVCLFVFYFASPSLC